MVIYEYYYRLDGAPCIEPRMMPLFSPCRKLGHDAPPCFRTHGLCALGKKQRGSCCFLKTQNREIGAGHFSQMAKNRQNLKSAKVPLTFSNRFRWFAHASRMTKLQALCRKYNFPSS